PADTALDDVTASVGFFVKGLRSANLGFLVRLSRDHRLNAVITQPVEDSWHPIGLVASQLVGTATRPTYWLRNLNRFHEFFEGTGLVNLTRGDLEVQRHAVAIAEQVNFGAETASGT